MLFVLQPGFKWPYLDMTMAHEYSLQVEEPGRPEDVLAQDPDVVVCQSEYLDLVIEVGRDGGEAGAGAVGLALAVGPLAVAVFRTVVREISGDAHDVRGQGQAGKGRRHQTKTCDNSHR